MKWSLILFLFVVLIWGIGSSENSLAADTGWNTSEHDYHLSACKRFRQSSSPNDTAQCGSYKSRTGYACCCDTCSGYYSECVNSIKLSKETCEKVKANCEKDCNRFLADQSQKF